jgi:hypothetical protein
MPTNSAFVFIKPHAVTDKVKELASETLSKNNIKILSQGTITSEEIDSKKLIDQHYYAIASKATILKPHQLNVPADKFKDKFGIGWTEALEKGNVYNALDACAKLEVTPDEMDKQWGICKKADKLIKFGGGFYCGLVEIEGKEPIYAFNGFFMAMRNKFTAPGLSIYYYSVEWDSDALSWADFRGKVLGPTDPAEAPADSMRGMVLAKWQDLGLAAEPNVGDNGVHASASPFEALAERNNWLGAAFAEDPYGKELIAAGISEATLKDWSVDPQVKGKSIFDQLEDMDSAACTAKAVELSK